MKAFLSTLLAILIWSGVFSQIPQPEMVLIQGGTYNMGNEESEFYDEYPAHEVSLSSYYIGKYELTVEEYRVFCAAVGKPMPTGQDKYPAAGLSWEDAVMFCNWLSSVSGRDQCYEITRTSKSFRAQFNPDANGYRLPTEAEWEFAARGGNQTGFFSYSGGENPSEIAWFLHSGHALKPVGQKKPNELGLYDMSGNVIEICWDYYDSEYYINSPSENPIGPESGSMRVARGGSYLGSEETLRTSKRFPFAPDKRDNTLGLRLARNSD